LLSDFITGILSLCYLTVIYNELTSSAMAMQARQHRDSSDPLSAITYLKQSSAISLLNELREEFLNRAVKLNGQLANNPDRDERIDKFIRSYRHQLLTEGSRENFDAAANLLLKRFERLCDRLGRDHSQTRVRGSVYRHLLDQLAINIKHFGFKDFQVLVTPTLMSPTALTQLTRGLDKRTLYRAFTSNPQRLPEYFKKGQERLKEMESLIRSEPALSIPPYLRRLYAFSRMPDDIETLLRTHSDAVTKIVVSAAKIKPFRLNRSVVSEVVCRFGAQKAPTKLREIYNIANALAKDPELTHYHSRKSACLYAALSHLSFARAKQHLILASKLETKLTDIYQQRKISFDRKQLRTACLKSYDNALWISELLDSN